MAKLVTHKTLEKDLKQIREISHDERSATIAERRGNFEKYLRKKDAVRAAIALAGVASQQRILGLKAIMSGDVSGWLHVDRELFVRWLNLRAGVPLTGYPPATNLLHARAANVESLVRESTETIETDLARGHFADPKSYLSRLKLPTFALWLSRRIGIPRSPYDAVASSWSDGATLSTALASICDHHLTETVWAQTLLGAEFRDYSSQPVEIWAVRETRKREGLSMPEIDHPLMRTPFAERPPMAYDPSSDDELKAVLRLLEMDLPMD